MTKEELKKDIILYFEEIIQARACLQIHKTVCDAINTRGEQVNYAPVFFTYVRQVMVDHALLIVMKLFDNNKQAKTIQELLNTCKQNCSLFEKIIYDVDDCYTRVGVPMESSKPIKTEKFNMMNVLNDEEEKLKKLDSIIKNLKTRRDKAHVHNDEKYWSNTSDLSKDAPLKYDDFEALLDFADAFCNLLAINLDMGSYLTQSEEMEDLMVLLDKIPVEKSPM